MHDILLAVGFLLMLVGPAIIASRSGQEKAPAKTRKAAPIALQGEAIKRRRRTLQVNAAPRVEMGTLPHSGTLGFAGR